MMTLKTTAALLAAAALSASASANLLVNGGFEDPVVSNGAPFVGEWEAFAGGGAAGSGNSTLNPFAGAQHLAANIDGTTNSFAGAFQDVLLGAGETATFSVWALDALGGTGSGVELRLEFLNSVTNAGFGSTGNFVPGNNLPALTNNAYTLLTIEGVVPVGADTVRAVMAVQSFGGPANQSVYFDNAVLVPEPATAALLGLGGLAMLRRRK